MKTRTLLFAFIVSSTMLRADDKPAPNPMIDYTGFLENANQVQKVREQHRITEEAFIRMSAEPNTIILDARSSEKFLMLHVKGAKHLSLPDTTAEELAKVIPDKTTRILIYCNNNFDDEPRAFPSKVIRASLNLYTFNTLYSYGYRNVYELGPFVNIHKTILPFEGTLVSSGELTTAQTAISN